MTRVVLGLGSNRNYSGLSPKEILTKAVYSLSSVLDDMIFSSVYKSKAMYVTDQDDFYNMAVTGFFSGTAQELLDVCHEVENSYGRDRSQEYRNGPRPLDIDIETFGEERICTENLIVPHPRVTERAFVLIPVLEILSLCADVKKESIECYESALSKLGDQGVVLDTDKAVFSEGVYGRK